MKALACWAALAAFVLLALSPTWAHGSLDANIRILRETELLRLSFVIDGPDLAQFDRSGDEMVSKQEMVDTMSAIAAEIDSCLDARDAAGIRLPLRRADHPVQNFAELGPSDRVEQMRVLRDWKLDASQSARIDFGCFLKDHPRRRGMVLKDGKTNSFAVSRGKAVVQID